MGLIREPKGVDFYVINKPWTAQEKKEFSEIIKKLKTRSKIKGKKTAVKKHKPAEAA
ncbi:MAG TPA: hypothetical protein VNZ86_08165 [Bacteroidia bacterium]|jgi:hypothetical protein|nr:hypothetical protein [Bacteroidia bacterium]